MLNVVLKFFLKLFILPSVLILGSSSIVAASGIGIATGSESGNYIQFGRDIAGLLAKYDLDVDVVASKGSLENVAKVLNDDRVHMGLVQSDVLGYIQASNHKVLKKIPQQIKLMFPLYNEEVHLLANKKIQSITDLQNKIVAVGARGSGTNLTSELLFEISNVWPQQKIIVNEVNALAALKSGDIDAMFFVSGYPVKLFDNIEGDDLHLVSLHEEIFAPYYQYSIIPEGTYSWQASEVKTLAVKAMLMTYDFVDEHCSLANKMTGLIKENLPWLVSNGHPKWQEVDIDISIPLWERYPCVAEFFADGKKYFTGDL